MLTKLHRATGDVWDGLEDFSIGSAANSLYDTTLHCICDVFIEFSKPILYNNAEYWEFKRKSSFHANPEYVVCVWYCIKNFVY